jgi:hypothetical protein
MLANQELIPFYLTFRQYGQGLYLIVVEQQLRKQQPVAQVEG